MADPFDPPIVPATVPPPPEPTPAVAPPAPLPNVHPGVPDPNFDPTEAAQRPIEDGGAIRLRFPPPVAPTRPSTLVTPPAATTPPPAPPEPAPLPTAAVLAALAHVRHPRARIFVNRGALALTPIEADVISNNYYAADTFRVVLAFTALPKTYGIAFFADTDAIEIEVQYQLDPKASPAAAGSAKASGSSDPNWQSMIIGRVDEVDTDWERFELTLTGRDYSSVFLDEQTADKFANQTSSEIVGMLVDRHADVGLLKQITATKTPVGTYFPSEHAQVSHHVSEWQLMTFLAEQEGFDLFMQGRTLHFEPSHQTGTPIYAIRYTPPGSSSVGVGTLSALHTIRSMTVAKDVKVTVLSWNGKQGRRVKVTVQKSRTATPAARGRHEHTGIPGGGTAQSYVFRVPGLTEQQATDYANKKLAEISRHERIVEGTGPADFVLQPRMMVRLSETMTAFDQDYFCDAVERTMSFQEGFMMRIRLKNHSPESQVAL